MKKILLTCIVISTTYCVLGQGLKANSYLEYTQTSPKMGTSMGYFFKDYIEVGGFYQKSTIDIQPEVGRPQMAEENFLGAYFGYPLLLKEKASINFKVRTGIANGENFIITPSIMSQYKPVKSISLGAGMGVRSFRPTLVLSVSFSFHNQGKATEMLAVNTERINN